MLQGDQHWVFLGDSLTEGVGKMRVSFVRGVAEALRNTVGPDDRRKRCVGYIRLRAVDPEEFNRFIRTNFAGEVELGTPTGISETVVWNLGAESTVTLSDLQWRPFLWAIKPTWSVLTRGALESVIRPDLEKWQGSQWLPRSWRSLAGLDPRCYFGGSRLRVMKQRAVDQFKQYVRLGMLREQPGHPLRSREVVLEEHEKVLEMLKGVSKNVLVCGLLPISERTFPGSAVQFRKVNDGLRALANEHGVHFLDWDGLFDSSGDLSEYFYLDGFHPNEKGCKRIGSYLSDHLLALEPRRAE